MSLEVVDPTYDFGVTVALDVPAAVAAMSEVRDEVAADRPDLAAYAELGDQRAAAELGRLRRAAVLARAVTASGAIDAGLNNLLGSKE
jgi:hypothetical protein